VPGPAQPVKDATPASSSRGRPARASEQGDLAADASEEGSPARAGSPLGLIVRNAPLVVLGEAVPLVAAVIAMPLLLARLGVDRLGVLSLAWVVIGYFSMFDLGIGRATTQIVAAHLAAGLAAKVPHVVTTALALLLLLGCAGGAVLAVLAPWLVQRALQLPDGLLQESRSALALLALTVPLVMLTSGLRGILEAERRFATVAALRAALGLISFLGPLAVLPFSQSLFAVMLVLAVGRAVLFLVTLVLCREAIIWSGSISALLDRSVARELVRFAAGSRSRTR